MEVGRLMKRSSNKNYAYIEIFLHRCVDADGNKLRGSMGPSSSVHCSPSPLPARTGARSLTTCSRALCAGICEYGYKTGADGCPTCECDDPCAGYPCKDGEECVRVKDSECTGELCTGYPVCKYFISCISLRLCEILEMS